MPQASGGPLPPYIGCFTLSSPATAAEGLCLYNSGYLHWVRKPISHTHHLTISFISDLRIPTLWEERYSYRHWGQLQPHWPIRTSSFKLQHGCLEASVQHIDHYMVHIYSYCSFLSSGNTTALFTTEMLAGFIFSAASEAYRDLSDLKKK